MEAILILIPVSLVIVGCAIAAFFWAVDNDQYDDVDKGANDALFGDETTPGKRIKGQNQSH
jgi:cbb3-type cytochrome oxidase maturation protein